MFNLIKVNVQQNKSFSLVLDTSMGCPGSDHRVDSSAIYSMTINSQVVLKLYEVYFMIRSAFPMIVTMRAVVMSLIQLLQYVVGITTPLFLHTQAFP